MPTARDVPGFGVIGDKLYVVGGNTLAVSQASRVNTLEIYDPATDRWTTGAPMPTARSYTTVQAIDGKLYVAGGHNGATSNQFLSTLEVYDPATNTWAIKRSMSTGRFAPASGVIGGRFYVACGWPAGPASQTNVVESYDPVTDTWRNEASAITARWGVQGAVINQSLYLIGGGIGSPSTTFLTNNESFSVRALRVISSSGAAAGTVTLPIELVSRGDENALGFSLNFNPGILSNPQVALGSDAPGASLIRNDSQLAQGRLGIAIALPTGQKFAAGAREVAKVTFSIAANAIPATTLVSFGAQPIAIQAVDAAANILPVANTPGAVTVTPGYEADVSPRPNGSNNGTVTVADWVLIGRFSAGLETAAVGGEFQRADCAPKAGLGDGRINIADWVQAGLYASGIDAAVAAGGPTTPFSGLHAMFAVEVMNSEQAQARVVRAVSASFQRGQNGTLAIELDAQGNENALGFSLNFDPAQLRFVSANLGSGAGGATLNPNTIQAANGRVGIALALSTGQAFAAGNRQLLVVTFAALNSGTGATTTVTIGDQPVGREIVDAAANSLNANWMAATVTLVRSVATVSAASFNGDVLAGETIVAGFGTGLATSVQIANTLPLPTSLVGTSVKVKDSAGVERLASLFFVAPTQINYLIPAGTATGDATITIVSGDGAVSVGKVKIAPVAPGLFSASSSGQGIAAAVVLRVKADGSQTYEQISRFDQALGKIVAVPIDLEVESDQVFLLFYGTGWRNRSSLSGVVTKIGGQTVETLYAGLQGDFVGLDQINARLSRNLIGRGEVDVVVTVDGVTANTVRVSIK
ncbi:MAG: kelch repeat-containing protein [Acidobacteriota bacterium]